MFLERIEQDLKTAMLARQLAKVELLRSLKTAIVKEGKDLTEEQELAILKTAQKQRTDSAEQFGLGGNLAGQLKEEAEFAMIAEYLPALMTEKMIENTVVDIIVALIERNDGVKPKLGDVIKEFKKVTSDSKMTIDNKFLSEEIKRQLA